MAELIEHSNQIISQIKLPDGTTYEIHDSSAFHTLEDIADAGLTDVLNFKGTVENRTDLDASAILEKVEVGDVYHVVSDNYEYVWVEKQAEDGTIKGEWEEFGAPHDFVGTEDFEDHTHNVTVSGQTEGTVAEGEIITTFFEAEEGPIEFIVDFDDLYKTEYVATSGAPVLAETDAKGVESADTEYYRFNVAEASEEEENSDIDVIVSASVGTASQVVVDYSEAAKVSTWGFAVSSGVLTISGANGASIGGDGYVVSKIGTNGSGEYITSTQSKGLRLVATKLSSASDEDNVVPVVSQVSTEEIQITASIASSSDHSGYISVVTGMSSYTGSFTGITDVTFSTRASSISLAVAPASFSTAVVTLQPNTSTTA